MAYYMSPKKGKTPLDIVHEGLMRQAPCFRHFYSATVSLRIYVGFLNEDGKRQRQVIDAA